MSGARLFEDMVRAKIRREDQSAEIAALKARIAVLDGVLQSYRISPAELRDSLIRLRQIVGERDEARVWAAADLFCKLLDAGGYGARAPLRAEDPIGAYLRLNPSCRAEFIGESGWSCSVEGCKHQHPLVCARAYLIGDEESAEP